jgi:hypothetical protein
MNAVRFKSLDHAQYRQTPWSHQFHLLRVACTRTTERIEITATNFVQVEG